MTEGFHIDEGGNYIFPTYADQREPADRSPITILVRACAKQYAIENCKRIRISKPELYREYGESLVRDPGEGYASRTWLVSEKVNDPNDLAAVRSLDDERNRASQLVGSEVTTNTTNIREWSEFSNWMSFGKNCWIFCTSIEPTSLEEMDRWRKTMPDDYDHTSYIHRPREFARALGSMVAEQLGPQGKEQEIKHSFDGELRLRTGHKSQVIVHGPVAYVEDPYATISSADEGWDHLVKTVFTKGIEYRDQLEYRFVVCTDDAESSSETVDLDVSLAMLGAMETRSGESARRSFPVIIWSKDASEAGPMTTGQEYEPVASELRQETTNPPQLFPGSSLLSLWDDNSVPISPHHYDPASVPQEEVTTTYGAIQALRDLIGGPFGRPNVGAASSAWHVETVHPSSVRGVRRPDRERSAH